jgi:hypothetical protein
MRFLAVVLFAAACNSSEGIFPTDVGASLERAVGCGDAELALTDDAEQFGLYFELEGVIGQAHENGQVSRFSYDLADRADCIVELMAGEHLAGAACPGGSQPTFLERLEVLEGEITIDVSPRGSADAAQQAARIDLWVDYASAVDGEGHEVDLGSLSARFEVNEASSASESTSL